MELCYIANEGAANRRIAKMYNSDRAFSQTGSVNPRTAVVVGNTPYIASSTIASLPPEYPYFLVGSKDIAFLRRSKACQQYFENDLSLGEDNENKFVQIIRRLGISTSIFLIPVDDAGIRIVQATIDRLATVCFPLPDRHSFERLADKWQFYQTCQEADLPTPNTLYLKDKADIDFDSVRATVGLPFVLKPTNKSNGLGVCIVHSSDHLREEVFRNRNYDFSPLIAQTFIPGIDIDISILAESGDVKHFAVQIRKERQLWFVQNEKLVECTKELVRSLNYTGVMHIDARLENGSEEIFLLEANPRFWASVDEATLGGLNFVRAGIYSLMGYESLDPTTIYDVRVPSVKQMLFDIASGKRSVFQLSRQQRLRVKQVVGNSLRAMLHLPLGF